ncbi:MAG: hypothetical protein HC840_12130 [Leptolyngbyaceae cyanobacterium RM2_2_4]|nr:hypothetical protein [Leptolyngbyaceae cyanobacterium SM1_4_3]NJN89036.1 hypothetical protein [Leptolyngbyaceae cyanobacterium SL_5_14]NJO50053.1 hypothetical protein [Leptolyngbyaceae cyanobacterium RM2_2_4]
MKELNTALNCLPGDTPVQVPASQLEIYETMRWWHQRQALQLNAQATEIRDGLLQELFALRRGLEVWAEGNHNASSHHHHDWLQKIERLHQDLERISNHLSPPYLEESLPLAIQYAAESWRTHYPQLEFVLDSPVQRSSESPARSRIILTTLHEFLQIIRLNFPEVDSLRISLSLQEIESRLAIEIPDVSQSTLASFLASDHLKYLSQAFELLTLGKCLHQQRELEITWYFLWQEEGLRQQ